MKVGTKVKMINCLEAENYKDRVWVTRSEPWFLGKEWVVLLEGKSGWFAVKFLKEVKMYLVPEDSINALDKALTQFENSSSNNVLDRISDVISAAKDVNNSAEEYKEE
jgi:hypothetical protein